MKKQYRSPLMASIHETAEGLRSAGILDKRTMRDFDTSCLTPGLLDTIDQMDQPTPPADLRGNSMSLLSKFEAGKG